MSSIRRGQGLPHARHSQFQPAPMDPPQGTAETISQAGSASLKTYLRQGRKCQAKKGGGNKKSAKQQREHQGERSRRRCSMVEQTFPEGLQPVEDSCRSRGKEKEGVAELNR